MVCIEPAISRMLSKHATIEPTGGWKLTSKTVVLVPPITSLKDRKYNTSE